MATCKKDDQKEKLPTQLVKLDKAFKLAEQWVNNMSQSSSDEKSTQVEIEGRPSGLGIGAAVPRVSKVTHSNNPVERKLLSKLHGNKGKFVKRDEDFAPVSKVGNADDDSEEDELESKTKSFNKKKPQSLASPLPTKRKRR